MIDKAPRELEPALLDIPVPGQSLTQPPGTFPFERPPEIVDPLKALERHIDHLSEPEAMRDAVKFIEKGVPVVDMVEGILRSAVMSGIHNIDISIIIAPAVHEYLVGMLEEAEVEYDEGFETSNDDVIDYERNVEAARDMLNDLRGNVSDEVPEEIEEQAVEEQMQSEEQVGAEPKPRGLMERI